MEETYKRLLDFTKDGVYSFTLDDGKVLSANKGFVDILDLGCEPSEVTGKELKNLVIHVEKAGALRELLEQNRELHGIEYNFKTLKGEDKWVIYDSFITIDETTGRKIGEAIIKDITEKKRGEQNLKKYNRALRMLNECNQALVRAAEEFALLKEICGILAQSGGYRSVWVGYAEQYYNEKPIRIVAQSSQDGVALESMRASWGDDEYGRGPFGVVIKTGKPVVCGDVFADPNYAQLQSIAQQINCASVLTLPLKDGDWVFGILNICAAEQSAFNEDEVSLLTELADDLAYGIVTLRARQERIRIEEDLRISESNYHAIFEGANDAIFIQDIETGDIVDANHKACEMYCYPREEMLHLKLEDFTVGEEPYTKEDALRLLDKVSKDEPQLVEWVYKDKAGRYFWVEINLKRAVIGGKYRALAVVRDITERKQSEERLGKINEVFLNFSSDPADNINRLTALCGELLRADCALYNRLDGEILSSCGLWNVPPGFNNQGKAQGHICYDLIKRGVDDVVVVHNLSETDYARTDPNVSLYGLQTYVGKVVKFGGNYVGTLCAVYKSDFTPTGEDKKIISIVASAIGVEEERKSAEEVRKFAQFSMDRAAESIFWINPDAQILYVNDMACNSLGYSHEELTEMNVYDVDPNFTKDVWPAHWKEVRERGTFTFETVHRRKDGTIYPVEITVNYLQFQGEEYNCAFARDISERKRAETELMEEKNMARHYLDVAGVMMIAIGKDQRVSLINKKGCDILGYSEEEIIGKDWLDNFIPGRIRDTVSANFKKILSGRMEVLEYFENPIVSKGGEERLIAWHNSIIKDERGDPIAVLSSGEDITERKQAETDLIKRDYQLEILSRTSQHINAILEMPVILRTLVAAAMELVGASGGTAGLLEDKKMIFREYNKEGKVESVNFVFDAAKGAPGWILRATKPYISNNPDTDDLIMPDIRKKFKFYNMINVPILNNKGELLGCIELHDKENSEKFNTEDIFRLQGLAASAAIAMENTKVLTEIKKAEEALRESESQYRTTLDAMADAIHVIEADFKVILFNSALKEMNGKLGLETDVLGKEVFDIYPFLGKKVKDEYLDVFETGRVMITGDHNKVNDKEIITETRKIPILEAGKVTRVVTVIRDITKRMIAEKERDSLTQELLKTNKKLKQSALKDSLTGLYNYKYLNEVIDSEFYRARRYGHPLSLVMIDIDYFKSINDVYGHEFGDLVLKQFAMCLKRMVRRYDLVIRFGGEEFVVLSPSVDRVKALMLAQRLLDAINLYSFGDKKRVIKLKLSISVSAYPDDKITRGVDLVNMADKVLNKVKEGGGNKVFSVPEITKKRMSVAEQISETTDVRFLKEKIEKLTKRGRQNLIESIFAFAKTIELKDHYTGEHVENTVKYSTEIARELNLPPEDMDNIKQASVLHDLGKIGISDKILLKKAKLTKKEFDEIKRHPQIAADIIRPIQFMHDIVPLVLYHHERWDGKGYPAGLQGEETPIGARIIAVADVYQALTSNRPYRKAFSHDVAIKMIKDGSGTQFDPRIVDVFLKVLKREKKGKHN